MLAGSNISEHKRTSAFSLAELMVAIGILGVGMLIIAAAFPVALDQTRQAVELQTSQGVFNEAVNTLQTKIDWTLLENELSPSAPNQLGSSSIYLLDSNNLSNSGITMPNDCIYSQDDTYGWLTACEKLADGIYKFWIFVVREPSGIGTSSGLKTQFTTATASSPSGTQITINSPPNPMPNKGQVFLADNGQIYKIQETVLANSRVKCDKDTNGITNIAYITGTGLTRKAPTVWVYQTVINY